MFEINLEFTQSEMQLIEKCAKDHNMEVIDFIKESALEQIKKELRNAEYVAKLDKSFAQLEK